jgi:hypothetical protein
MVMTIASKNEYHIVYDDGTQIAKFTASKIEDVWKKYNKRCDELLVNKKDIPSHESFGNLAWTGNLKKNYKPVTLRLAKVTESGYIFENKEVVREK